MLEKPIYRGSLLEISITAAYIGISQGCRKRLRNNNFKEILSLAAYNFI